MSITPTKFNCLPQDLGRKVHNLHTDTLAFILTNTAPNVADTVYDSTTSPPTLKGTSNAPELTTSNGYTVGGIAMTGQSYTQVAELAKLACAAQPVWTSATGNMGPFRYCTLVNLTAGTTSTRPLICFWDRGASLTLDGTQGDTFTQAIDITDVLQMT